MSTQHDVKDLIRIELVSGKELLGRARTTEDFTVMEKPVQIYQVQDPAGRVGYQMREYMGSEVVINNNAIATRLAKGVSVDKALEQAYIEYTTGIVVT